VAVINTGLVPKALAAGLGPSQSSSVAPGAPQAKGRQQGRQQAQLPSSAKRLLSQVRAMKAGLAAHNDGGPAFIRDNQTNAYGPPVMTTGGSATPSQSVPIEDVIGRIERARQKADEAFR
jgi:hypothetical protein